MRAWVARNAVETYYALAIVLSWGYWLTLLAMGVRVEPGSRATHLPGLFAPAVAAVLVTTATGGVGGLRELFGRITRLRAPRVPKVLLALSPIAIGGASFAALSVLGRCLPPIKAFSEYPGLPTDWPLALVFLAVLVLNGFGEEIGWRGFATEKWLSRYGPFKTTLLVGFLWAAWHAPVFWLNRSMASLVGPGLLGWAFGLLCGAFVLTNLYLVCGHSVLCAAVWHAAFNMMVATEAGRGLPAAVVSTIVMVWGIVVALRWWRSRVNAL